MKFCAIFALLIGTVCAVAYANPASSSFKDLQALLQTSDEDKVVARLQEALAQVIGGAPVCKMVSTIM